MKNRLAQIIGFFVITLTVVVYLHLAKQALLAEIVDGVLASLAFTLFFGIGVWWGAKGLAEEGRHRPSHGVGVGLVAGALMWSSLWSVWSVVPASFLARAAAWAFYGHLALAFGTGWLSTRFRGDNLHTERAEQELPSPSC